MDFTNIFKLENDKNISVDIETADIKKIEEVDDKILKNMYSTFCVNLVNQIKDKFDLQIDLISIKDEKKAIRYKVTIPALRKKIKNVHATRQLLKKPKRIDMTTFKIEEA